MKVETFEHLRCPACGGGLEITAEKQEGSEVLEGRLACRECEKGYEIAHGLPNLVASKPPEELVPEGVEDFRLRWVWRGTFYIMEFRKGRVLRER